MNRRIAILAACAGTLALAQADIAVASSAAAIEAKTLVRIADVGPAIVVAQNAAVNTSRSNIKHPSQKASHGNKASPGEANSAMGEVSTTRGRKLPAALPKSKK